MNEIFLACCALLVIVPLYFVWHRVYKDGVIGRASLLGISFAASTFIGEWMNGTEYRVLPQTALLVWAFTVFLLWHLWRFHRRVLKPKQDMVIERRAGADRRFNIEAGV